mgnify:CR=1 FL=1
MNTNLLRKYAALVVRVGVNLQEDQPLVIHAPITCADFVHALAAEGYCAGAHDVAVNWSDGVFAGMSKGERKRCRRRYKKYMNSRGSNPRSKISVVLGGAQIGRDGQEAPGAGGLKSADRWGGVLRMSSTVRMLTRSPAVDEVAVTTEGVGALSVSIPVMDVYNAYRYALLFRDPWWKREPSKKRKWAILWS